MTENYNTENRSYFDGGTFTYFGLCLLAALVNLLTLGIARPWMECMLTRWQSEHTVICGKRMEFDGTGGQLFGKYIIWWLLTVITLGIYSLWMNISMMKWKAKHTHFAGEDDQNSFFDGGVLGYFGIRWLANLVTVVTFGLCTALGEKLVLEWEKKHTVVDSRRLVFQGSALSLFGKYFLWGFLSVITLGIFGFWIPVKKIRWVTENTIDNENTAQAIALRSEYHAKIANDAALCGNHRMQADMEVVHAGLNQNAADEDIRKAAENKVRCAEYLLAVKLANGSFLGNDEAYSYLSDSAYQGYAPAMYLLAVCDRPLDSTVSEKMLKDAAAMGNMDAMGEWMRRLTQKALEMPGGVLTALEEAKQAGDLYKTCGGVLTQQEAGAYHRVEMEIRRLKTAAKQKSTTAAVIGGIAAAGLLVLVIGGLAAVRMGILGYTLNVDISEQFKYSDRIEMEAIGQIQEGNQEGDRGVSYDLDIVTKDGISGETVDPAATGKITIINFWGTWRSPSLAELPYLQQIAEEYGDKVTVVAIHSAQSKETAAAFIGEHYADSPIIFALDDGNDFNGAYYMALGGRGTYPYTVILDENNIIEKIFAGSVTYEDLERTVDGLLPENEDIQPEIDGGEAPEDNGYYQPEEEVTEAPEETYFEPIQSAIPPELFATWLWTEEHYDAEYDTWSASWEYVTFRSDGTYTSWDMDGLKVDMQTDICINGRYYDGARGSYRIEGTYTMSSDENGMLLILEQAPVYMEWGDLVEEGRTYTIRASAGMETLTVSGLTGIEATRTFYRQS